MSILDRALSSRRREYKAPPDRYRKQHKRWEQMPSISNCSRENGTDHEEIPKSSSPPVNNGDTNNSQRNGDNPTNFDRFLECATPVVRARHLPKTIIRQPLGRTIEIEHPPYFDLKDLWDYFNESRSIVAVPLVVYGTDSVEHSVTQYYVPYLSGIQLYIHPKRPPSQRMPNRETSSNGCNGAVHGARSRTEIADENITRLTRLSHANRPFHGWSGVETRPLGELVFEYFEDDSPSERKPLFARMKVLTSENLDLMTYRSCDLSPSSWISLLWFPIHRRPDGPNLPIMDACFLTYHCLSTQSPSTSRLQGFNVGEFHGVEMTSELPLNILGLAFFKLRVSLWIANKAIELPKAKSLLREAKNWLKRLQVRHQDFLTCSARPYI